MRFREMVTKMYGNRYGKWLLHLLFWLFIFVSRYYIQQITFNAYKNDTRGVILSSLFSTVNIALSYYVIVRWIYPHWLKKGRYFTAIAWVLALVVVYTLLDHLAELYLLQDARWRAIMQKYQPEYFAFLQRGTINIVLGRMLSLGIVYQLFLGLALPMVTKMFVEYSREQMRRLELARQNLQLELNFLKSQVNPHFLFNTLNNIYSLILHDKKEQSADMVARLSAFMRYSFHETNTDKTSIEKEMQLMKDYIELERVRLNYTKVETSWTTVGVGYQLPPLLLLPLLENAFKYCPDEKQSIISISLRQERSRLCFVCSNTYDPGYQQASPGGVGINNIIRRLERYYPGHYTFRVSRTHAIYSVDLCIEKL